MSCFDDNTPVILGACRTPIGKLGGNLSTMSAVQLGAVAVRDAIKRASIDPLEVEYVEMGCVIQASLGQNVARQVSVAAGIPYEAPAQTTNVVCGSGLQSINNAARLIKTGEASIVVAGGTESMSNAPYAITKGRFGYRHGNGELVDTMINDALWDAFGNYHMMVTAETVAKRWNITREEADIFSANSQKKCQDAISREAFVDEIVPVNIVGRRPTSMSVDEGPRTGITQESLSHLKCASGVEDGVVTAGNSSGINDGAAAIVLSSAGYAHMHKLTPLAVITGGALVGTDPAIMGLGPVPAVKRLLEHERLKLSDFGLFEFNEAFAVQAIAVARELNLPDERTNVNGGAIALGHPVGATGCRILVTLLYEMMRRNTHRGISALCVGGGMGCATAIELV